MFYNKEQAQELKIHRIKKIISTKIYLSKSHGCNWQDAEKFTEELIQNNLSKLDNFNFYTHSLINKLLKNEGVVL